MLEGWDLMLRGRLIVFFIFAYRGLFFWGDLFRLWVELFLRATVIFSVFFELIPWCWLEGLNFRFGGGVVVEFGCLLVRFMEFLVLFFILPIWLLTLWLMQLDFKVRLLLYGRLLSFLALFTSIFIPLEDVSSIMWLTIFPFVTVVLRRVSIFLAKVWFVHAIWWFLLLWQIPVPPKTDLYFLLKKMRFDCCSICPWLIHFESGWQRTEISSRLGCPLPSVFAYCIKGLLLWLQVATSWRRLSLLSSTSRIRHLVKSYLWRCAAVRCLSILWGVAKSSNSIGILGLIFSFKVSFGLLGLLK